MLYDFAIGLPAAMASLQILWHGYALALIKDVCNGATGPGQLVQRLD